MVKRSIIKYWRRKMSFLKRNLIKVAVFVWGCIFCVNAWAGVQFLPGSGASGNVRANHGNSCIGYLLTQPKCNNQACSAGWSCTKCVNDKGSFYKCYQLRCNSGYTPGKIGCPPCQKYEHSGFSGNLICGKCTIIDRCLESASGDGYTSFEYLNSVTISGNDVIEHMETGYQEN